ncbi:MAG: phytoene desaturase [Phycisphaerales bacterium]|nr:phytoene desaturase [Phycisphaerales bacterium]
MITSNPHTGPTRHAVVIGGGLAGLAAAVELAGCGWRVSLIEKNTHLGGKMNVLSEGGYTFDMGPTIITLPQVLRGIVRRTGRRPEDYIDLIDLDPQWRLFYEDGQVIDLRKSVDAMAAALDRQFPGTRAGEGYRGFIAYARRMYRLSEQVFFYKDLGGMADLMRAPPPRQPGIMKDVLAMRLHSTVGATAHKMIAEPHVRQLVEHFLQYVGSSPFLAPAILSLIAAAQVDHGCWYPMGGTRMVARTLERIAGELGVEVIAGAPVETIIEEGGRAAGVVTADGRTIRADAVISNCDVQRTHRDLLASAAAKKEQKAVASRYTPACSGVVLYLGLTRQYDHLAHHNFLFSSSSQDEFDDIYGKGIPARDPTLYLAVPSRTDPSQAPPGHEALYVLIHTPYLRPGQRWEGPGGLLEQYRPTLINKLKACGRMPDIERHIAVERHLTPQGIDTMYNAEGGAIYGLASHGRLVGGFKPRNRSRVLKSLYLAGGSVNPGPGVPMVLMSGVTAARAVCEDFGVPTAALVEPKDIPAGVAG